MPYSMPRLWSVGSDAPYLPLSYYLSPQQWYWPFPPCSHYFLEWIHSCAKWMHSRVVFSAWRTSVSLISSGEMPWRFQLWLMSEKHSSADSSPFFLVNGLFQWSFWSWFCKSWIHNQDLYQVTHSSRKSEMMDRWPYTDNWTVVPAAPHSRWHPSPVTPSSRE